MDFGMPTLLELESLEQNAALCKALGLKFVEINMNFPQYQLHAMDVRAIRALSGEYGVYFTVHLEEAFDPCAFNPAVRTAYLDTVRQTAALADALSAPVINLHLNKGIHVSLPGEKAFLFERFSAHYESCMRAFAELCALNAGGPLRFCVENTGGFAPFEKRALEMLLEYPCFSLTLDVGHSHAALGIDEPFYLAHNDRLAHVHLHDAIEKRNHLALGEGEIDLAARLKLAMERGCRVVVETKTVEALKTSVQYLVAGGFL